jgi:hypothetical protein
MFLVDRPVVSKSPIKLKVAPNMKRDTKLNGHRAKIETGGQNSNDFTR